MILQRVNIVLEIVHSHKNNEKKIWQEFSVIQIIKCASSNKLLSNDDSAMISGERIMQYVESC